LGFCVEVPSPEYRAVYAGYAPSDPPVAKQLVLLAWTGKMGYQVKTSIPWSCEFAHDNPLDRDFAFGTNSLQATN
jgi:hypothetical protein